MGRHLERARILLAQSRYALAEKELRAELAADPDNALAHALLGLCLASLGRYGEAESEAKAAIALIPDAPFPHYSLAHILNDRLRLREAERAVREAIRLDPEDANFYGLLAGMLVNQNCNRAALTVAEQGLKFDPTHVDCLIARAFALKALWRRRQTLASIEAALSHDPENYRAHYHRGLLLIGYRKWNQARESLEEALRLNPEFALARLQLVRGMTSRLRWRLCALVFVVALSAAGLLFLAASAVPALEPHLLALGAAAWLGGGVLCLVIPLTDPLLHLILRRDSKNFRHLLAEQVMASNLAAICLLAAIAALLLTMLTASPPAVLGVGVALSWMLPIGFAFRRPAGWQRWVMLIYAAGLTAYSLALFTPLVALFRHPKGPAEMEWLLWRGYVFGLVVSKLLELVLAGLPERENSQ